MTNKSEAALLPAGLRDTLPPDAAHEARVIGTLLACFDAYGYDRAKPPLVEFEESLLGGVGAAMANQTFRLMDPVSQRMMGVRADMTLQMARIATTRLAGAPRPLRLSYAGEVLRIRGTQLEPERQLGQVGVELIGTSAASADAEAVLLAGVALARAGVRNLSVDLNSPMLVREISEALDLEEGAAARLRDALEHKDAARVASLGGKGGHLFGAVMAAAGPANEAVAALANLDLPAGASAELARVRQVIELILAAEPTFDLTLDPAEFRGFEYHTGVSFTLFCAGVRGELGRGGRYMAGSPPGEPATGFTLFTEALLRALPAPSPQERLYLPLSTTPAECRNFREAGWIVVAGLEKAADTEAEARRLGCSHALVDGGIVQVG